MHRRGFLTSAAAAGITLVESRLPRRFVKADEPPKLEFDVNAKLEEIAAVAGECCQVTSVKTHIVPKAKIGLTQWEWGHWRYDVAERYLPMIEAVNREIFNTMERVEPIPDSGLDTIVHEGLVLGKEARQIAILRSTHEELIRRQYSIACPIGAGQDIEPSEEMVQEEILKRANQFRTVNQVVRINDGSRQFHISPLGRLGAAVVYSKMHPNTQLLPAEDPHIDKQAEGAEQSGNPALFKKWVKEERDAHFINIIRTLRLRMPHILLGYDHDLTDDIGRSNCVGHEAISHIIITVNGVAAAKRIPEKIQN